MSRIFITGDTHGDIDFHKLNTARFNEGVSLTKDDYVIICGDFGAIWRNNRKDRYLLKWYDKKPWTTLFIDGNHENHDVLDQYPVTYWHGGKVHQISSSVIHLMRGQVFDIDGRTFFTMGGAQSHDKIYRTEGISWWAREMPSDTEYEEGLANLRSHNNQVDFIVSHCIADSLHRYEHDKLTNYLEIVRQSVDFQKWFCGHYHTDQLLHDKYQFLYYQIVEI